MLEHLTYLTDRPYRRQMHAELRGATPGIGRLTVVHESDQSCCKKEPWTTTLARIVQAISADGVPSMAIIPVEGEQA